MRGDDDVRSHEAETGFSLRRGDALRVAAEPLAAVDLAEGLAFESVTDVAYAARGSYSAVGRAAAQLSRGSAAGAKLREHHLVERGGELDLQLAAAVEVGPPQASREQELA